MLDDLLNFLLVPEERALVQLLLIIEAPVFVEPVGVALPYEAGSLGDTLHHQGQYIVYVQPPSLYIFCYRFIGSFSRYFAIFFSVVALVLAFSARCCTTSQAGLSF